MKKVLIVEKDDFTNEMLYDSISSLTYKPFLVGNQSLAIALIETDPDIIIIHRACFTLNRHLFISAVNPKKEKLSPACIILTSNTFLEAKRVEELGADFFLLKPFDLDTLSVVLVSAESAECKT